MTPVEFLFRAPNGAPIAYTNFEVRLRKTDVFDRDTGMLMPRVVVGRTDRVGRCVLMLAVTDQLYDVYVNDPYSRAELHYRIRVPPLTSSIPGAVIRLQDILVSGSPPPVPSPEAVTLAQQAATDAIAAALRAQANTLVVSDTAPTSPGPGSEWIDTRTGRRYAWYIDDDTGQWVETGTSLAVNPDSLIRNLSRVDEGLGAAMVGYDADYTVKGILDELVHYHRQIVHGSTVLPYPTGTNTLNLNAALHWTSPVTGSLHLANPSAMTIGQRGTICLTVDDLGGHPLSFGTWWKAAQGALPTETSGPRCIDLLEYFVLGPATIVVTAYLKDVR